MLKLISLCMAVGLAVLLSRRLELGPIPTLLMALVGVVGVHILHGVLRSMLYARRGGAAIAKNHPLMLEAYAEAKRTWADFVALLAERPNDAVVKFRLLTAAGTTEIVWGDLVALNQEEAVVTLKTPPFGGLVNPGEPRMTIPLADVVDWQIVMDDETLRGGFTQQATFRIIEREKGSLTPQYKHELARYRALNTPDQTPLGVWQARTEGSMVSLEFAGGQDGGTYKQITEGQGKRTREFGSWTLSEGALHMLVMASEDQSLPGPGQDRVYQLRHITPDQISIDGPGRTGMVYNRALHGTTVDIEPAAT